MAIISIQHVNLAVQKKVKERKLLNQYFTKTDGLSLELIIVKIIVVKIVGTTRYSVRVIVHWWS